MWLLKLIEKCQNCYFCHWQLATTHHWQRDIFRHCTDRFLNMFLLNSRCIKEMWNLRWIYHSNYWITNLHSGSSMVPLGPVRFHRELKTVDMSLCSLFRPPTEPFLAIGPMNLSHWCCSVATVPSIGRAENTSFSVNHVIMHNLSLKHTRLEGYVEKLSQNELFDDKQSNCTWGSRAMISVKSRNWFYYYIISDMLT